MKFSIGDVVRIKGSGIVGTVHQCESREMIDHSGSYTIERYFIKTDASTFPEWYHVSQLEHEGLSEDTRVLIDKMLIDVHLKYRQFETVKGILKRSKKNK